MRENGLLGATAFILVVVSVILTALLFSFQRYLSQADWINFDVAGWSTLGLCVVGTILGELAKDTKLGKISAGFGLALLLIYLVILMTAVSAPPPTVPAR